MSKISGERRHLQREKCTPVSMFVNPRDIQALYCRCRWTGDFISQQHPVLGSGRGEGGGDRDRAREGKVGGDIVETKRGSNTARGTER